MSAFGPLAARFLDAALPPASAAELAACTGHCPDNALLLDAMCGTGRLLVPLLRERGKVHGVDASAAMLERCEANVAAAGLATSLFRQDVTELNLPFRYGAAFVAGGALQFVTDPAAVAAALGRLRAHLVTPGLLVLDLRTPPTARQNLAAPLVEVRTAALADGSRITLRAQTTWTPEARYAHAEHRYSQRRGTVLVAEEHEALRSTWYASDEACELMRAAGFDHVTVDESVLPDDAGTRLVVVGRMAAPG